MAGPLDGIRIVDLSQIVSGPMAAMMLADQGAEVIKVESPGGDPVRGLGPKKGDRSSMFIAVNRGKRSLCLDLKTPGGAEVLERLIGWADVLVENFRPGTMARLGFAPERCLALNPRLVFASITGFGPTGPYANIRVYDPVIQAVSGLAATQVDKAGVPGLIRSLIADKVTALTAAQAITAALFQRERSGRGQLLEVAMLDAVVAFNWPDSMYNHAFQDDPPPAWPEYGANMRLWQAADGQVAIGALQDVEFIALCRAVGRLDLAEDPRFRGASGRMNHQKAWAPEISRELAARTLDELMAAFVAEGAVGGRVNRLAQVPDDPQVRHNRLCTEIDHPGLGRVRMARPAARFGAALPQGRPAPALGEHDSEILDALGFNAAAIAALTAEGAIARNACH